MKQMLLKFSHSKKGFSLIECVISLLVFSLVMILFASMFMAANAQTRKAQEMDNALNEVVNLAEERNGTADGAGINVTFTFSGYSGTAPEKSVQVYRCTDTNGKMEMKYFE